MLNQSLAWRMGALYLRRQMRQTLLSVLAGAIGAMLITMSIFHYGSVRTSGEAWLKAHFGPVDWALVPAQTEMFTSENVSQITGGSSPVASGLPYRYLPAIAAAATIYTQEAADSNAASISQAQVLGFDWGEAAAFDPANSYWSSPLKRGEALLDRTAAEQLGIKTGDAVYVTDKTGQRHGFVVRETPAPAGLNGYRGDGARLSGTLLLNPEDARLVTGLKDSETNLILATRINKSDSVQGMSMLSGQNGLYDIRYIKMNAEGMANSNLVAVVLIISMTAVFSSAFLLRQIVLMMAESRSELYGVLRAIGLNRGQVRSLFRAEALLLGFCAGAAGIVCGIGGGYAMVRIIYGTELAREIGASGIPVEPGLPLPVLVMGIAAVFAYQLILILAASRNAGSGSIVAALRGGNREDHASNRKPGAALWKAAAVALPCAGLVALHLYLALAWKPEQASSQNVLGFAGIWLFSVAALILLLQACMSAAGKRLGSRAGPAVMLAVKYAGQRRGRTFTVMLLFAIGMMAITFTSGLGGLILGNMDPSRGVRTILGYDGFVPYESIAEKEAVERLLKDDEFLRKTVSTSVDVKALMAAPQMAGEEGRSTQAVFPVTEELKAGGSWSLSARSPEFADDDAAWSKVMSDPGYIVLPNHYRDYGVELSDTYWRPKKLYKPGEKVELGFFRNALVPQGAAPDLSITFTIAGFAEPNTADSVAVQYAYAAAYVHPDIWGTLQEYHHPWVNQTHLGLLLMKFDHTLLEQDNQIVQRLVSGGAGKVIIPYLEDWREHSANKRLVDGFIGFAALSSAIGLLGLAVLQKRSIHERQREIAMLRSAGVPSRLLRQAFLLEGSMLGGLGMLAGWGIGLSGAQGFIRLLQSDLRPWEQTVSVSFQWGLLGGVMLVMMLLALLFQLSPARSAMAGSPAETLRGADL
ncbi:MAG: transporter permease [Paenibacillaceae bacterium]|nr:transporter permease [Paenibacillaceae bacterium]